MASRRLRARPSCNACSQWDLFGRGENEQLDRVVVAGSWNKNDTAHRVVEMGSASACRRARGRTSTIDGARGDERCALPIAAEVSPCGKQRPSMKPILPPIINRLVG